MEHCTIPIEKQYRYIFSILKKSSMKRRINIIRIFIREDLFALLSSSSDQPMLGWFIAPMRNMIIIAIINPPLIL